jgi:hypothetical protein
VTNAGTDLGLLAPTASAAKEILEAEQIKVVADSGYYKGEDIAACEAAGIEAYVARPQRGSAVREGLFRKEEFHYDAQNDRLRICEGHITSANYVDTLDIVGTWYPAGGNPTFRWCDDDFIMLRLRDLT